jgi:hypothetical protein
MNINPKVICLVEIDYRNMNILSPFTLHLFQSTRHDFSSQLFWIIVVLQKIY